jgi:hypothetical protein
MCEVDWPAVGRLALEILKIGTPLIGAWFIAKQAVKWALDRYKDEKMWERRLITHAEAIEAVTAMASVVRTFKDEGEAQTFSKAEVTTERLQRYRTSREKLELAAAISVVLLPAETGNVLSKLVFDLREGGGIPTGHLRMTTPFECGRELKLLTMALFHLEHQGRAQYGTPMQQGG